MIPRLPTELEIDFREFSRTPQSPREFLAFWEELSKHLVGKPFRMGATHEVEHPRYGTLRLTVIFQPPESVAIGQDTLFAVHSILEQSNLRNTCARCHSTGKVRHGAYTCIPCQHSNQPHRVCEEHVVILSGGMRLDQRPRATCDFHVPSCKCGQRSSFWCVGPRCRRQSAWCERHRKQHPSDPNIIYCPDCYSEVFPACTRSGCRLTATSICEYVTTDGLLCARRSCSLHDMRWQIYGPHKIGLGLCEQHRQIKALGDDQILYQVVAATAMRQLHDPRSRQDLPSLQSIHHIMLKARNKAYGIAAINQLFIDLSLRCGAATPLERMMSELLKRHERYRAANIARDASEKQQGLPFFETLKAELRRKGWNEIAEQLVFSDYKPKTNSLFIRLPEVLRGRLIGKHGATIKMLSQTIGSEIRFEKGE